MSDVVNKPPHYTQGNIEVIDFILDQKFSYIEGNIIKYVSRWKHKNGVQDLKKAQWYLNKLISLNEGTYEKDVNICGCGNNLFNGFCANRNCAMNKE